MFSAISKKEISMTKRKIYKKPKDGGKIQITARQLNQILLESNGKLKSRQYADLRNMDLVESSVRDAINELKEYSLATLAQRFDVRFLGRGKRVYVRLDRDDGKWYHFSLAYIPRAINNRDINDAIMQMFFIGKWRVHKLSLWAEPEEIMHYGNDFNDITL